mmetsp:Transcript_18727/g.37700  ORF Transcript_18727/g.37700 Transcript_18727/m.37700 type:complete len:337 (+) Transcript_18727:207-1217(+)
MHRPAPDARGRSEVHRPERLVELRQGSHCPLALHRQQPLLGGAEGHHAAVPAGVGEAARGGGGHDGHEGDVVGPRGGAHREGEGGPHGHPRDGVAQDPRPRGHPVAPRRAPGRLHPTRALARPRHRLPVGLHPQGGQEDRVHGGVRHEAHAVDRAAACQNGPAAAGASHGPQAEGGAGAHERRRRDDGDPGRGKAQLELEPGRPGRRRAGREAAENGAQVGAPGVQEQPRQVLLLQHGHRRDLRGEARGLGGRVGGHRLENLGEGLLLQRRHGREPGGEARGRADQGLGGTGGGQGDALEALEAKGRGAEGHEMGTPRVRVEAGLLLLLQPNHRRQ